MVEWITQFIGLVLVVGIAFLIGLTLGGAVNE